MKTISISLNDIGGDETVTAEYFQIEEGWVTFKTSDGKVVASYPEARVIRIVTDEASAAVSAGWVAGVRYVTGLLRADDLLASIEETNPFSGVGTTKPLPPAIANPSKWQGGV